ncbi:MAG TPA: D-glycerate dehydrogenase [Acidobacteria bacterium]|jgi:glyoxylate reductase|nr:D-glycerate dehydrogenase [Acidobacteriota bacterium]|tara:strand:- start:156 stop:1136 length:981 start_codon:yes stop_codon:yes gene_type:complete
MKSRVLVTNRIPAAVLQHLESDLEIDYHTEQNALSRDQLLDRVRDKHGLLCVVTDTIDAGIIKAGSQLRVIANIAVGYDNIDIATAKKHGIVVTNTPGVLTESVAELTWGLILNVTRRVVEGDRLIQSGVWKGWALDFMLGMELFGKQLGVVGAGRIGRAVAARASVFGMKVVFAAPKGSNDITDRSQWTKSLKDSSVMPLDRLLATSDVVSLHVPMTSDTHHLIDREALVNMKPSAYLINTSRGPVVDEDALVLALREGLIAGAALDVYEREPMVHSGLLGLSNVVLSPHLGSATHETRTAMADLAARNLMEVLSGNLPITPINS